MNLTCILLLVLHLTNVSAQGKRWIPKGRYKTPPQGCNLVKTKSVKEQLEPSGEPLFILVHLEILGVRDVPDRGGSYGVDVE